MSCPGKRIVPLCCRSIREKLHIWDAADIKQHCVCDELRLAPPLLVQKLGGRTLLGAGQKVPEMTPEFVESVSRRYIELFEHITGKTFVPAADTDLTQRIESNVVSCLKSINA